jgi:hypothetical protein
MRETVRTSSEKRRLRRSTSPMIKKTGPRILTATPRIDVKVLGPSLPPGLHDARSRAASHFEVGDELSPRGPIESGRRCARPASPFAAADQKLGTLLLPPN